MRLLYDYIIILSYYPIIKFPWLTPHAADPCRIICHFGILRMHLGTPWQHFDDPEVPKDTQ